MVFLSGNQVTRLVNRMEVLSEKLHPSWQCATCVQLETSVSRISMLSPLSLHNHCCYLFISQKCNGRHFIWLLILMLKQPKAAISADFVCLPLLLSSLFMFSDSRRYVEGCHLNCWQDCPIDSQWSNQLFTLCASEASVRQWLCSSVMWQTFFLQLSSVGAAWIVLSLMKWVHSNNKAQQTYWFATFSFLMCNFI